MTPNNLALSLAMACLLHYIFCTGVSTTDTVYIRSWHRWIVGSDLGMYLPIHVPTVMGLYLNMMTSSNGNIFRVTGPLCGEFTGPRWIPCTQRPVTQSFDVFFDLCLNKRLSKQSWGWWFETPPRPLWRHRNDHRWSKGMDGWLHPTTSMQVVIGPAV